MRIFQALPSGIKAMKFALTCSILWLFSGCSSKENNTLSVLQNVLIQGKASPILLQQDSTGVILQDFVTDLERIDSITTTGELSLIVSGELLILKGSLSEPLAVLTFWSNGIGESTLIKKSNKQIVSLQYAESAESVMTRGEFNAWNQNNTVFEKYDAQFKTQLTLNPGSYQYLLVVDGKEIIDPSNPDSVSNGMGGWNSVIKLPRSDRSKVPLIDMDRFHENEIASKLSNSASGLIAFWNNTLLPEHMTGIEDLNIFVRIPDNAKGIERSLIRFWAFNEDGVSNEVIVPLFYGQPIINGEELTRSDRESMIMYFLMVDRFNNGNPHNDEPLSIPEVHPKADFYGGDLIGVADKINDGYFEWLGINTLWLSPITQNPTKPYGKYPNPETSFSAYHGYWPISNIRVDHRFGTSSEFQKLVDVAHEKNTNVLLDYVANHVHEDHPIYQNNKDWATPLYLPDGTENTQKWDEHRLTTWFDTFMPTLDLSRPEIVDSMTDSAMFWLNKYGIDGFRHDATKHIPLLFWRELTKKVKEQSKGKTLAFQIGETYGSRELINSYINTGMLDAQFDFNMYDAVVAAFAQPESSFENLVNALEESTAYYGDHHLMGNITGNQDRARFISYADGSLRFDEDAKLAGWTREITIQDSSAYRKLSALTAFMMVIPGIPCIYYGDEYGSFGGNDPDNRKMMKFDGLTNMERNTRDRTRKLIKIRRDNLALTYGDLSIESISDQVLVIRRKYFQNEILAIFNKSKETIKMEVAANSNPNFFGELVDETLTVPAESFDILTFN